MTIATNRPAKCVEVHLHGPAQDGFVTLNGQEMYRIGQVDQMPPFLMSLVSDTDLWMYLSSTGGLTAGRVNEDGALFPYETDDRLHGVAGRTGPLTMIRVHRASQVILWEPMGQQQGRPASERNLYRNAAGNHVIFEEIRKDLGLVFRYAWQPSEAYGFVRSCTLENIGSASVDVELIDGLVNLLPAGSNMQLQQGFSCLINAYSQCEVLSYGLAVYAMTAQIVDRAEPAEALRANVAWMCGLDQPTILLSADQLPVFVQGGGVRGETILKGRRGAYLAHARLMLQPGQKQQWHIVIDTSLDQPAVASLVAMLSEPRVTVDRLQSSIQRGQQNLEKIIASADGLQVGGNRLATAHHLANAMFNSMRGGIFASNHLIESADLRAFIQQRNHEVSVRCESVLAGLPAQVSVGELCHGAYRTTDADLARLYLEYLPLTFSRRHGDPSRPWNKFTIRVKEADGRKVLDYQGNWRDIFQNWEALCASFPGFIESVIAKFVSASTVDGFNPYRITRQGIDWEVVEPENPWSNIGYWGDHQIVYLLRLLELSCKMHPGRLAGMLNQRIFSYANVPYRLKPYSQILKDRWATIDFDHARQKQIEQRVQTMGADGKLLVGADGRVLHVNLVEKLLVPLLSKLSNLVVDGGIWMNTQRPEWNDANNALVGNGISMVTFYHLRRYVKFIQGLLAGAPISAMVISSHVARWLEEVGAVLVNHAQALDEPEISDELRKLVLDELGLAFERYRVRAYEAGPGEPMVMDADAVQMLLRVAMRYLDHGITANRRADGLYHAYNLLRISADGKQCHIDRLGLMLEGQVAALSSGMIRGRAAAELVDKMFASGLYRADQSSFMLYPIAPLPGYMDRNILPEEAEDQPLLSALVQAGEQSIVRRDVAGRLRFAAELRNGAVLSMALAKLSAHPRWSRLVQQHSQAVLDLYEQVFHHAAFTGRSGTMYGYEGIGCIYWHMVSKLLLAVQECHDQAIADGEPQKVIGQLAEAYYRVRQGLGFNKSARNYGAFPTDPYSHTPGHAGAQQPGMTGQVKEELLTRRGEMGVTIDEGRIGFSPRLLDRNEYLSRETEWQYVDAGGNVRQMVLPAGSIGFTLCQVPVIYRRGDGASTLNVTFADGMRRNFAGHELDASLSRRILDRDLSIAKIEVTIKS